jgi:hypothetical protein
VSQFTRALESLCEPELSNFAGEDRGDDDGGGERGGSVPQLRHKTEFSVMCTMLRNWKDGKAHLQDLQGIGRQDRMSEFPRSQAMAPHTQSCCFPEHELAQQLLVGPGAQAHQ